MDELLKHCLQQLAFDGDLGCNVSRLRDFVSEFYSSRISMHQNLDDSYHTFIWSLVAQHPSVRIGLLPLGQTVDVYVPPQPRVSKKGKAGQDDAQKEGPTAINLELIPNARYCPLDELVRMYGDRLRIAVDSETCFVAVTGSHARPAKLTPMVYATLQIIARSRENGISVLDIGKATKYDQKTCFYLVKQLLDLDLVVKLRRPGNSQNFCVHKYFFDRSPIWRHVREEENRASGEAVEDEEGAHTFESDLYEVPQFDPIDTRHLTSLTILRQRLVKLLKHSPEGIQPYTNISVKIGFYPRSRTDRRFFIVRLNELINEGTLEKIFVPSANPDTVHNKQIYLRLRGFGSAISSAMSESTQKLTVDDEMLDSLIIEDDRDQAPVKTTRTLHRQIIDILQESGTSGATLNELSDRLGSYDKKTLELLISRMERQAPPPHLADLSVVQLSETHGRERRHRFFTLKGYLDLVAREGLDQPSTRYSAGDLTNAGSFMQERKDDFYETQTDLQAFYSRWGGGGRTNRPRISASESYGTLPSRLSKMSTQGDFPASGASSKKRTNPTRADGTRKRGRPPKEPDGTEKRAQKRAKTEPSEGTPSELKDSNENTVPGRGTGSEAVNQTHEPESARPEVSPKRKRGRPPKKPRVTNAEDSSVADVPASESQSGTQMVEAAEASSFNVQRSKTTRLCSTDDIGGFVQPSPSPGGTPLADREPVHTGSADLHILSPATHSSILEGRSQSEVTSELRDEFTRVIASLADQINESFQSGLLTERVGGNVVIDHPTLTSSSMHPDASEKESGDADASEGKQESDRTAAVIGVEDGSDMQAEEQDRILTSARLHSEPSRDSLLEAIEPSASGPLRRERRINLAAMRRENELVQLIESAGGIVNTSTAEFLTAHTKLIEETVKAGDATSAPVGTRLDRRTLNYALDKLQAHGRIRLITTNLPSGIGGLRNAKIAYLPSISEDQLRDWLSIQGSKEKLLPFAIKKAQEEIEMDPNNPASLAKQWLFAKDTREMLQERWHKNPGRAEQLFAQSDDVVREAMLMEKQTLSQLYGYSTGKVARARQLHLCTIDRLEKNTGSRFIMSTDERIINLAFFENDITLETHCACIPALALVGDIKSALQTDDGRKQSVKDIPDNWKQALQVGKAGSLDRISDLLDFLHSLRLVRPVRRVVHGKPSRPEVSPDSYEEMPPDWATKVPLIRPVYWKMCEVAPLHLFSLGTDPAPFWKDVRISSREDAGRYWSELKAASLDRGYAETIRNSSFDALPEKSYAGEQRVVKALRRPSSWADEYTLSWYQTQYLKRFIDYHYGITPVQNPDDEEARLQRISDVIHAPLDVVREYYRSFHEMIQREFTRKRQREEKSDLVKKETDMKLRLAQKKLEAIKSREAAWEAMVKKAHPGLVKGVAASRLRKLRQSFVGGNVIQDNHHWELQIQDAIKAAEKMRSSRNLFPNVAHSNRGTVFRDQTQFDFSQLPPAAQGKPVDSLVDMQQSFLGEEGEPEGTGKRRGKKTTKEGRGKGKAKQRRSRFQWNADYDELLRDAYAILRARCRTHYRLEWAAIEQVFPSVPRVGIRSRLAALTQQPGADAYLQRLENCWHELWVKKRGTPELPDPNPRNPTDFDLKAHVQYLRKCVDKNAIRVGVSAVDEREPVPLPTDPNDLLSEWNLEERKPAHTGLDFLFNSATAEEIREKLFTEIAFVSEGEELIDESLRPDSVRLAESALKMVVGTPDEAYNATDAAALLHSVGKEEISIAIENLLSRNVLAKLNRDPSKHAPGRTIKISEINQSALGGPIAKDLFTDAYQLEDSYARTQEERHEWPLTSNDGDTAALLQLISDHQVEFDFDTSRAQAARGTVEGNSRKVDDDDIELCLRVNLHNMNVANNPATPVIEGGPMETDSAGGHGRTASQEPASCGIQFDGVIDCLKCIEECRSQLNNWPDTERQIAESMLGLVDGREKHGVMVEELKNHVECAGEAFTSIIHNLHTLRVPLLYLTGYSSTVVSSAKYASAWAVTLPTGNIESISRVLPRRWLDLDGSRIKSVWESGLRAVVGLVHLRPGISQAELRWRLRAVYDRQEVFDLCNHLLANGALTIFYRGTWNPEQTICIEALSKEEEKAVFWSVRQEKRWYQIS